MTAVASGRRETASAYWRATTTPIASGGGATATGRGRGATATGRGGGATGRRGGATATGRGRGATATGRGRGAIETVLQLKCTHEITLYHRTVECVPLHVNLLICMYRKMLTDDSDGVTSVSPL